MFSYQYNRYNNYIKLFSATVLLLGFLFFSSCSSSRMTKGELTLHPKREFRGAWIQTVYQDDYSKCTAAEFRKMMKSRLTHLKSCGINAVIFQVRPEADAFYKSKLEPWSRFLTGKQGRVPDEKDFDPMAFLIEECHKRNMEFHAWLNPYRAGTGGFKSFVKGHIYYKQPEWFVEYNNQVLFDPGVPDCRRFICLVVRDIVDRYDVDAIHMDDYFYPYPVAGKAFPDDKSFSKYGLTSGFKIDQRDNWRRDNVNCLIKEIKQTIAYTKPWVRFGISPFGIYSNRKDGYRKGSKTNGLQNYDDLYADILLWMKKGWIDYCVPQVYWEIGHKAADYDILVHWWNKQKGKTPLYIGQDVARTMKVNQLDAKMQASRDLKKIEGNIFWPANEILWNKGGVADSLKRIYHRYPALIPAYDNLSRRTPKKVEDIIMTKTDKGYRLSWNALQDKNKPRLPSYFIIYRSQKGKKKDTKYSKNIYAVTRSTSIVIPYTNDNGEYKYIITAVDRYHNESKGKNVKK